MHSVLAQEYKKRKVILIGGIQSINLLSSISLFTGPGLMKHFYVKSHGS